MLILLQLIIYLKVHPPSLQFEIYGMHFFEQNFPFEIKYDNLFHFNGWNPQITLSR